MGELEFLKMYEARVTGLIMFFFYLLFLVWLILKFAKDFMANRSEKPGIPRMENIPPRPYQATQDKLLMNQLIDMVDNARWNKDHLSEKMAWQHISDIA